MKSDDEIVLLRPVLLPTAGAKKLAPQAAANGRLAAKNVTGIRSARQGVAANNHIYALITSVSETSLP